MSDTMKRFFEITGFTKGTNAPKDTMVFYGEEISIEVVPVGTQFVVRVEEETRFEQPRVTFKVSDEAYAVMYVEGLLNLD